MIGVITGDIINSRRVNPEVWQTRLKEYFISVVENRGNWEIYRGDSFQLEVKVELAVEVALCIKALIKSISGIDVRMAIGIGEKNFKGEKLIESSGSAFINSGESFDELKNRTFNIKTPFSEFDEYFNAILKLISFVSNNWKPVTSETIFYMLTNKSLTQKEIAIKLEKDSTTINKALKRGAYYEIIEIINLFSQKILQCSN